MCAAPSSIVIGASKQGKDPPVSMEVNNQSQQQQPLLPLTMPTLPTFHEYKYSQQQTKIKLYVHFLSKLFKTTEVPLIPLSSLVPLTYTALPHT